MASLGARGQPGVVAGPWPAAPPEALAPPRRPGSDAAGVPGSDATNRADRPGPVAAAAITPVERRGFRVRSRRGAEPELDSELPAWPARGLAAAARRVVAAWLFAHAVAPSVPGPAAAALIAGLAVAALPRLGWLR